MSFSYMTGLNGFRIIVVLATLLILACGQSSDVSDGGLVSEQYVKNQYGECYYVMFETKDEYYVHPDPVECPKRPDVPNAYSPHSVDTSEINNKTF